MHRTSARPDPVLRTRRPRLGLGVLVIVLAALLGACTQRAPQPPSLTLETLANWWATAPDADLSSFATMRIEMTFENASGATLTFAGDAGGADPAAELQFWTTPSVDDVPATFDVFPEGSYAAGATFAWDVTFDLSAIGASETGIAVRPNPSSTLGPDVLTLVDATVTLGD